MHERYCKKVNILKVLSVWVFFVENNFKAVILGATKPSHKTKR